MLDMAHDFAPKVNTEMVSLGPVNDPAEIAELRGLIEDHRHFTGSAVADRVLKDFHHLLPKWVRVMPHDEQRVRQEKADREAEEKARLSHIDLVPSHTASQVDLVANIDSPFQREGNPFGSSKSRLASPVRGFHQSRPQTPAVHEPSVGDLEDAMEDDKPKAPKIERHKAFVKYKRLGEGYRPARKRVKDFKELSARLSDEEARLQASRCMTCKPFCVAKTLRRLGA